MKSRQLLPCLMALVSSLTVSLPSISFAQGRVSEKQAMDKGSCGKLSGRIAIVVVPVSTPQQKWDEAHLLQFRKNTSRACRWLEKSAKACGQKLELYTISIFGATLELQVKDTCPLLENILPQSIGEDSLARYLETNILPFKFDQAAVMYVVPCHGRAFARITYTRRYGNYYESIWYPFPRSEIEYSEETATAIAHEILHLFGAMDFYHLKSVPPAVKATIARSIMLMPGDVPLDELEVDPITQYLIGWRKKPEKEWKAIFKQPNLELMGH